MLAWYRDLIAARRTHAELRDPHPQATRAAMIAGGKGLALRRGPLTLYCNFTNEPLAVDMRGSVVLASRGGQSQRELPPIACALVRSR